MLVVAGIFALGIVELLLGDSALVYRGSAVANVLFLASTTIPLLWRRQKSVEVLAVVLVGVAAWIAVLYQGHQPPIEPFFSVLIAIYSAAAFEQGRRLKVAGGIVLAAGVAQSIALVTDATTLGNELPVLVYFGIV